MPLPDSDISQAFRNLTTAAISPAPPPCAPPPPKNALTMTPSRSSSDATRHPEISTNSKISTASLVLSLVSEVTAAVSHVPYVGAIANIVTTLIKIREEVETNKERSRELLDRVIEKIEGIFTHLLDLKECNGYGDLKRLESQMRKYYDFLQQVAETVSNLQKRPIYERVFDRGTDELEKLDRRINNLDSDLILGVVMEIMKASAKKEQITGDREIIQEDTIATHFPPAPLCVLERDSQHREIVTQLVSTPNVRVALLGMGGIGKTTLACTIANDPAIVETYPRRLFLSFEDCSTPDLAYTNLATAFHIPADRRSSHQQILSQVLSYLKQKKTLFVIDNFETFWDVSSNRRAAEDFLAQLAALRELAIIVTLRGIRRPGNIRWLKIEPLQTLTQESSTELLSAITDEEYTGDNSQYVQKLLKAVAGIPLAVTIIGALLRDESETPQSLWNQWTRENARAIQLASDIDSDDRLYKLDTSLRLSIFGPRMNNDTRSVLAAISILPTGLNMDEGWLDEFQNRLPATIRIRDCVRTLKEVALGSLDSSTSPPRLRLLPPVREFCLKNLPNEAEPSRILIDIYSANVRTRWHWETSEHYDWWTTEISNVTAVLNHTITLRYVTEEFGYTIYWYTEWRSFLCMPDTDTIERGIGILSEYPKAKAKCLQALGSALSNFGREKEAIQRIEQALAIHREVGIKFEVGWDLYLVGTTYYYLNDYPNAEQYLSEARELFTEINRKYEHGSVLRTLADTYHLQGKLPQAESTVKEALELCRTSGNRQEEATALVTLGSVYRDQSKYDLALESLEAAAKACKDIHDIHGEACAHEGLGFLYRKTNKLDLAALHIQSAISLFEQAQDATGTDGLRAMLEKIKASANASETNPS